MDGQPELLAASSMRLRVRAPEDARVTATAPPADGAGRQRVWTGDPAGRYTVEFLHGRGFAARVRSALNRPLISLVDGR